jgi:glycosyltransferase involved in cell wall biosynthesis
MKLSIVIPALNEEQSIKNIINRCIEAKPRIIHSSDVSDVEIIVVSDGSTDNTVPYAREFEKQGKIKLIVFEKNKGYGAAIKKGWEESDGDLLAFIDADGTCDPNFFSDLSNLITKEKADIALGCRLNKNSRMPLIRRAGNTIFSILLSVLATEKVKDTASGMRIVRREILKDIYPLPDGLHFTPAMSAKAVTNPEICIKEIDMSYKERVGESKLHVLKDGIRFFSIIIKLAFMYRPQILLLAIGVLFSLLSFLLLIEPVSFYFSEKMVLDTSIYRISIAYLGIIIATILFICSYLSEKIVRVSLLREHFRKTKRPLASKLFESNYSWILIVILFLSGLLLISHSFIERIETGKTYEHWSRYLTMMFLCIMAFILMGGKIIDYVLKLIIERKDYLMKNS